MAVLLDLRPNTFTIVRIGCAKEAIRAHHWLVVPSGALVFFDANNCCLVAYKTWDVVYTTEANDNLRPAGGG